MTTANTYDDFSITVQQCARDLMPAWDQDEWFYWPPDLFALTSILLKTTGIYRYAATVHPAKTDKGQNPRLLKQIEELWIELAF